MVFTDEQKKELEVELEEIEKGIAEREKALNQAKRVQDQALAELNAFAGRRGQVLKWLDPEKFAAENGTPTVPPPAPPEPVPAPVS